MEVCDKKDEESCVGSTSSSSEDALSLIRTDVEKVLESELIKLKEEKRQRDASFFETKAQRDLIQEKYYNLCTKINDLIKEIQKHDSDFNRIEVDVAASSDSNINALFESLKCAFMKKGRNFDQKDDIISSSSLHLLKSEQENEKQKLKQQIQVLCQEQETLKNELESSKSHAFSLLQKLSCARSELITSEENHRKRIAAAASSFDHEKQNYEVTISLLRSERDGLASTRQSIVDELGKYQKLLVNSENEITTLKESLKNLKVENEELKNKIEILDVSKHQSVSPTSESQPPKANQPSDESIRRLEKECDRLRNHLLSMEERYTQEAVESEAQKEELSREVKVLRDKLVSSAASVKNAQSDSSRQLESVVAKLSGAIAEKEDLQKKLHESETLVSRYSSSIQNLHAVLEQFEKDQQLLQLAELEKCRQELKLESARCQRLAKQNASLESELDAMKNQSEQIKEMEEKVRTAANHVVYFQLLASERDECIRKLKEELNSVTEDNNSKVDKVIMKNLLMGYVHAPLSKKVEAFSIIGKFLDFSKDEFALVNVPGSWSNYLKQQQQHYSGPAQPQSFSELFVKFLESESRPTGPALKMSTEVVDRHHHTPVQLYGRTGSGREEEDSMQRFLHSLKQQQQQQSVSSRDECPEGGPRDFPSTPEVGDRPAASSDSPPRVQTQPASAAGTTESPAVASEGDC